MAYYRLYFMSSTRGQITGVREFEAPNDFSAIAAAERLRSQGAMELWCRDRKVGQWNAAAG